MRYDYRVYVLKNIIYEQHIYTDPAIASFWTGGTRKNCNGHYSWCFSKTVGLNRTLDSQVLASFKGNGACVLGSYTQNAYGSIENTFINEDCTTKAQIVCVFNRNETNFEQEENKLVRIRIQCWNFLYAYVGLPLKHL